MVGRLHQCVRRNGPGIISLARFLAVRPAISNHQTPALFYRDTHLCGEEKSGVRVGDNARSTRIHQYGLKPSLAEDTRVCEPVLIEGKHCDIGVSSKQVVPDGMRAYAGRFYIS